MIEEILGFLRTANVAVAPLTLAALFIRINSRWDALHHGVKLIYTGILCFPFAITLGSIHAYLIQSRPTVGSVFAFLGSVLVLLGLVLTRHLGSDAIGRPRSRSQSRS